MAQPAKYAYFTQQFLQNRNPRHWRIALLVFDRIALPINDANSYFTISQDERNCFEYLGGNLKSHAQTNASSDGKMDVSSLSMKAFCNGQQYLVDDLKAFADPIRSCDIPGLNELLKLSDSVHLPGTYPCLHSEMLDFVESKLPWHEYNNFPDTNLVAINDLIFGIHFLINDRGAVLVDRHDFDVLTALSKANLKFKYDNCPPWIEQLPFETYSDFSNAFLSNIDCPRVAGMDAIATCQIPAFDDLTPDSILNHKKQNSIKPIIRLIEEEWNVIERKTDFRQYIADRVCEMLWAMYDDVKPTRRELTLAIGGALPLGPINPFSLLSIGENLLKLRNREHQCLIALNSLRTGHKPGITKR